MSEDDTQLLCLDLGWASSTRSRTAAALLTRSGRIRVAPLSSHDDAKLASRLAGLLHPYSLILLDIPIEGCAKLRPGGPAVRPVDRRLARARIPVLPSVKAGMRGHQLKRAIRARARDVTVQETYPFAVLRVLWALHISGKLGAVKRCEPGAVAASLQARPGARRTDPSAQGDSGTPHSPRLGLDFRSPAAVTLRRAILV